MRHLAAPLAVAAATCAIVAPSASAVTVGPSGTGTLNGLTTIVFGSNPPIHCTITAATSMTGASATFTVTSITVSGTSPLCASTSFTGLSYTGTFTSTVNVTMPVKVSTPFGTCAASPTTLFGTWNAGSGQLTFTNQTVGSCTVSVAVAPTPNWTVTP